MKLVLKAVIVRVSIINLGESIVDSIDAGSCYVNPGIVTQCLKITFLFECRSGKFQTKKTEKKIRRKMLDMNFIYVEAAEVFRYYGAVASVFRL